MNGIQLKVAGKVLIQTNGKTGKRYPVLQTSDGTEQVLTPEQENLIWYLIGHDMVQVGQHIIIGTDGDN